MIFRMLCLSLVGLSLVACDAKDECLDAGGRYLENEKRCEY